MGNLFGKKMTAREMMRESQRLLRRGMRDLDRERTKLQQQEKKVMNEIKALAKKGQIAACKIMAKDLVRTRQAVTHFYKMKAQLQATSIRIQTMQSTAAMESAMRGAAKAMYAMNKAVNIPQMQKIMMTFERETDMMEMKQELMDEVIDDATGVEDEEAAAEEVLSQIFDELGVQMEQQMTDAPSTISAPSPVAKASPSAMTASGGASSGPPAGGAGGGGGGGSIEDDLAARLNNLRNNHNPGGS